MLITIVAGARPNFMKIAPIIKSIHQKQSENYPISYRLVHTGQHYDNKMSGNFFIELGIPEPHCNLQASGRSHAALTASVMVGFENELLAFPPDVVLVVGDVTSTMACAITAKKLNIDVVHVEAGIRSGDISMPEEINRLVTDAISDHFFTTSEFANENLRSEGASVEQIHFVGNTMIDTLMQNLTKLQPPNVWVDFGLQPQNYFILTLHRPGNVDDLNKLQSLLDCIQAYTQNFKIVFPVHPRTRKMLGSNYKFGDNLIAIDPLGYHQFIYLVKQAKGIITDSGGITEEATVLGVPCLTLRQTTERPETITLGTNELIGEDMDKLQSCLQMIIEGKWKKGTVPFMWDGMAADRIVSKLCSIYIEHRDKVS